MTFAIERGPKGKRITHENLQVQSDARERLQRHLAAQILPTEPRIRSLTHYFGELAALTAALLWAITAVLFRKAGVSISPLHLNFVKGLLAVGMLALWLVGVSSTDLLALSSWQWTLLLVSGGIGIGVGDTAFFAALNRLGEQQTVLVAETLAPLLTVLLAFVFLAESLSHLAILGIGITVAGVVCGLSRPRKRACVSETAPKETPMKTIGWAVGLAVVAALCQSVGAVISRQVLVADEIGPAASSFVRLAGGLAVLVIAIPMRGDAALVSKAIWTPKMIGIVLLATLLGTLLGIVCQQASLTYTSAGVSQTLIATSTLFVVLFALIRGERVSWRATLGAVIAIFGVSLLFIGKN